MTIIESWNAFGCSGLITSLRQRFIQMLIMQHGPTPHTAMSFSKDTLKD